MWVNTGTEKSQPDMVMVDILIRNLVLKLLDLLSPDLSLAPVAFTQHLGFWEGLKVPLLILSLSLLGLLHSWIVAVPVTASALVRRFLKLCRLKLTWFLSMSLLPTGFLICWRLDNFTLLLFSKVIDSSKVTEAVFLHSGRKHSLHSEV